MEMNFCRRCGSKLTQKAASYYLCENSHRLYVNAAPSVGIFFVTDTNDVLLSIRGIEPFKGMLDTFGGFVEDGETVEEAMSRELEEEIGLMPDQYETPIFISTEVAIYPFDGEDRSLLGSFFWTRLKPGVNPVANDDVAEIVQIPLADIDFSQMDNADVRNATRKLQKLLL